MSSRILFAWSALAWLVGTCALHAESPDTRGAIEVQGRQEVQIGVFANTNPTCTGLPAPEIRILAPGSHGVIAVKLMGIRFGKEAKACADKQLPALGLFYQSNDGLLGVDTIRIEIKAGGASQERSYTLNLKK